MSRALSDLIDNIELEKIDINIFRGKTVDEARNCVYGGQVLAQSINAASRTVTSPYILHSAHAYFLREGDVDMPVIYEVDRIRDGKTFTTRRVVAIQHGKAIFNVSLSYQIAEEAVIEHQIQMPEVAAPNKLINDELFYGEMMQHQVQSAWPIEYRQVDPINIKQPEKRAAKTYVWFKSNGDLADDHALHQELLAYASDHLLLKTALRPHAKNPWGKDMRMASLDHTIWYHQNFRIDEWLLYEMESTVASASRAFSRGMVFNQKGQLVASTAQEGVIRRAL